MLKVSQIKVPYDHTKSDLENAIIRKLKIPGNDLIEYKILKQSLDARQSKKSGHFGEICYQYGVSVTIKNEKKYLKRNKSADIVYYEPVNYHFPYHFDGQQSRRPVVIGFGPAGMFAGLMLAQAGLRPVIYERGSEVAVRMQKVNDFWNGGSLDPECNVQFGEGGAGTFSDGKLNTLVKDPTGRHQKVLEIFVDHGAPEDILYVQKPHIGTDLLTGIVRSIREEILSLGGEIHFDAKVTEFVFDEQGLCGLQINGEQTVLARNAILAIGHSARDTYQVLYDHHMDISRKPFAIGVRAEHPQNMINLSQYGTDHDRLPAASYKLTARTSNGRSVYTFCMCPGGYVVNASSEEGRLAVNGMSNRGRDGQNANSAVIVNVTPEDFGSEHPLAGVEFQRKWESLAYREGKGKVPVQLYKDFKEGRISTEFGQVRPEHKGATSFGNLWECLPDYVCESISEGMGLFGRKLKGYDMDDAILSGVETRTSSPVKMARDDAYESNLKGIFPCGEGAGYAGGITSAAMDGIRIAEAVAKRILEEQN